MRGVAQTERWWWAGLAVGVCLASGCLPDLGQWEVGTADGAVRLSDGGPLDPPQGDASVSDACAPPVTCAAGCPLPWVMAVVQDLDNDRDRGCGGRIWRWSLQSQDDVCACAPLDAGGALDDVPYALGFVPPATVVVGGQTRVQALDANTDTLLWQADLAGRAIDVVPIFNPAGQVRVMVGTGTTAGERVSRIDVFEPAGGNPEQRWFVSADLGVGSFEAMTVSPFNRQWMRFLRSGGAAATDIDPWNGVAMNMPSHTAGRSGFFLHTISATFSREFHQTVWTGERTDQPGDPSRVFRVSRRADPGDNRLDGGDFCQTYPAGLAYDVECDFRHAVPDPLRDTASLAVCDHGSGQRRLVRLQTSGSCQTIVEQTDVGPELRLWRLALAQPGFWAQ